MFSNGRLVPLVIGSPLAIRWELFAENADATRGVPQRAFDWRSHPSPPNAAATQWLGCQRGCQMANSSGGLWGAVIVQSRDNHGVGRHGPN